MKIVVLAGGLSTERDVSLLSGTMICNTMRKLGHEAILVDAFFGVPDAPENLKELFVMDGSLLEAPKLAAKAPDLNSIRSLRPDTSDSYFGPNVVALCQMCDICYLGLHGEAGENGQVQAALDMLGVKYTGSGYLGSAVAMHKGYTKNIFLNYGVPTPKGFPLMKKDAKKPLSDFGLAFPVVVKPCSGGSSVGVYIVYNEEEYQKALSENFKTEKEVLIEEYIKGREFAVGVLGNKALPVIEIVPKDGWFDYEHKYQDGATSEICPADLDEETAGRMQKAAEAAAAALSLEVYSRMDFIMTPDKEIYCLEGNSLPGMTPASLIPKEAYAAGMTYPELCEYIIEESLRKYDVSKQ